MSELKEERSPEAKVMGCVLLLALWPVGALVDVWAIRTLWAWIATPAFNLAPLTWLQAFAIDTGIGLAGFFLLHPSLSRTKDEDVVDALGSFVARRASVASFVAVAWVILKFMGYTP